MAKYQGLKDKRLEELQRAVKYDPDDAEAQFLLGNLYSAKRKYDKAIRAYNRVLKIDPGHYGAHRNLATIYETVRSHFDLQKAAWHWEKCVKEGQLTKQAKIHLERLRGKDALASIQEDEYISPFGRTEDKEENRGIIDIDNLSGEEFEDLIHLLLVKMGYSVQTTKRTGDGGVDLVAYNQQPILGGKYIIQCKRYSEDNRIGAVPIRDLFGVMHAENANKGILITTSYFTRQALEFAEEKANGLVELIDREKLMELLDQYLKD